jgi:predicted aspartyl protease
MKRRTGGRGDLDGAAPAVEASEPAGSKRGVDRDQAFVISELKTSAHTPEREFAGVGPEHFAARTVSVFEEEPRVNRSSFFLGAALTLLCAGSARAGDGAREAPIELDRNILFVQTEIDGHGPYLAMLDTGTDPSAIDLELARELGLKLGSGGEIDGGGTQTETASETRLATVRVGSVVAHDVEALAGESISKIARIIQRPVRAVLGKSFLANRIVQIDYPAGVVRFPEKLPGGIESVGGRRAVLRVHYGDDLEVEGVRVDGTPVRAIIDTGSNGALKITPEAVERLGLDRRAAEGKASQGTGYRGTYTSSKGRVESLTLGVFRIENPEAVFWSRGTGHDGKPWEVNIGNAVLRRFVVTLDAPAGLLIVEKPQASKN